MTLLAIFLALVAAAVACMYAFTRLMTLWDEWEARWADKRRAEVRRRPL
jgi:hypothetical protein